MKLKLCALLICLLPAACTWVDLNEDAKNVEIIDASSASDCRLLGTAATKSAAKVGILQRKDMKVSQEVQTLARNSAAEMGGNAISAADEFKDGQQTFKVYLCPETN